MIEKYGVKEGYIEVTIFFFVHRKYSYPKLTLVEIFKWNSIRIFMSMELWIYLEMLWNRVVLSCLFVFFSVYSFSSTSSTSLYIYVYVYRHRHAYVCAYMHTHTYINIHTPPLQTLQAQLHLLFLSARLTDIQVTLCDQYMYHVSIHVYVFLHLYSPRIHIKMHSKPR